MSKRTKVNSIKKKKRERHSFPFIIEKKTVIVFNNNIINISILCSDVKMYINKC